MLLLWLLFGTLALGPAAFIFLFMKRGSKKTWLTKVDPNYHPKISIIVPTYNESQIILLKLNNLSQIRYPRELLEIVIVDSNSCDGTPEIVKQFSNEQQAINLKMLNEEQRKGKSNALNYALNYCNGDVIIVSDADCFWPSNILEKALPFLADSTVGAIGGPKIIMNSNQNWITRMEHQYLKSANLLRLGESKVGSTLFFEGGFAAFKKQAFDRFDPYNTGSDDCGTVIRIIENNYRALLIPEAVFYSTFPSSLRGKISIKLRRTNQLVRVFAKYLQALSKGNLKTSKGTVIPNTLLYLVSPCAFIFFIIAAAFLLLSYPVFFLLFGLLLVPAVRFYSYEILESNILLITSIIGVAFGKRFTVWSKPEDRDMLKREALSRLNLV